MRRIFNLRTIRVAAVVLIAFGSALGVEPVWKLDLQTIKDSTHWHGRDVGIKFVGRYLIVYSGSAAALGHAVMLPTIAIDSQTGRVVPEEALGQTSPPAWEECGKSLDRKPYPAENIVDCRKGTLLLQVGGTDVPEHKAAGTQYYLQEPGRGTVSLFTADCVPYDPSFVSDDEILINLCNYNNRVIDKTGKKLYDLPKLVYPYIVASRTGGRFAVYERYASLFHVGGTSNRVRVRVYRSRDGAKLFEYGWHSGPDDSDNDGRVALSDDGELVALVKSNEVLAFPVSPKP